MSTETRLRRQLDAQLRASEPPFATTAAQVRARAARTRRGRRLVAAAAAGVAATVVVAGLLLPRPQAGQVTAPPEPFDPDRLVAAIVDSTERVAPAGWTASARDVVALDAQSNPISDPDRDKASRWEAEFEFGARNVFRIHLSREGGGSVATQEASCTRELDSELAVTCEVFTRDDGTVVQLVIRGVTRQDGAWPVTAAARPEGTVRRPWLERTAVGYHPDGSTTGATEWVRASSLGEAMTEGWVTSAYELMDIAADPALRYPDPPPGINGCDWIVPERQHLHTCNSPEGWERQDPAALPELIGRWEPVAVAGRPVVEADAWQESPWIEFVRGGRYEASDSCNHLAGRFSYDEQTSLLAVGPGPSRLARCANFPHPLDRKLTAHLDRDGPELILSDESGSAVVSYRPVSP